MPAHSSYVTQPLDVAVFSPLKTAYRQALEQFGHEDFGSALAKRNFLLAYAEARQLAFTRSNILSAWEATGLWPVDISKPLNNPFLVQEIPLPNSQPLPKTPSKISHTTDPIPPLQDGKEIRAIAIQLKGPHRSLEQLALRKAAKALDAKTTQIAFMQLEKRALEQQVEDLKPKKKRRVVPDIGRRFVQVAQINGAIEQLAEVTGVNKNTKEGTEEIDVSGTFLHK